VKAEKRLAGGLPADFHSKPRESRSDSCAESLGGGFLGRKAGRQRNGWPGLGAGVSNFRRMKDLFQKTIPEAIEGILNPFNLDEIHAQPEESLGIHVFSIA
jgi:hypothetical protein